MNRKLPIGVLLSGGGTNLQAIIDAIEQDRLDAEVRTVVSNREDAYGLTRARTHDIPATLIDHRGHPSREAYDRVVVEHLEGQGVELVVLAGFMRLLSPFFIRSFPDRIMNIHPALSPSFAGLHGQKQAFEYGVRFSGCTVHFVTEGLDEGPIIIQAVVPVLPHDTEETVAQRILAQEHRIYPRAIQLYSEGRLVIEGRRVRVTSEDEIRDNYRAVWNRVNERYREGYCVSERNLQAILYEELRTAFPETHVIVEPTWKGSRPDIVLADGDQITDIFELKFQVEPDKCPVWRHDVRKLLSYRSHRQARYPVGLNPATRERQTKGISPDCRLHFVAIAQPDCEAVWPESIKEPRISLWYGRTGAGKGAWGIEFAV